MSEAKYERRKERIRETQKEEMIFRHNKKHIAAMKFRITEHMIRKTVDKKVAGTGIYRGQHHLLMQLFHCPDCTQVEIAEKMEVSAAAVAVGLKKLEKGGYIERRNLLNDNRSNSITLTPKGMQVVDESIAIFHELDDHIFRDFSEEELDRFIEMLERMYKNMNQCEEISAQQMIKAEI
ncbi:MAG: MarR family transcriptional regulator [Clostridiales bacterium]|mgnify:CR=1 FL=1|nr:MarR family transcriptional regulator [Clostridiales bacterium]